MKTKLCMAIQVVQFWLLETSVLLGVVVHVCNPSLAFRRWREKDQEFEASLGYIAKPGLQNNKTYTSTYAEKRFSRKHTKILKY
jgi:hypothetical protein